MVICSSEGCDESGGVDSLAVDVPGVQSAGSPLCLKHDMIPQEVYTEVSANTEIAATTEKVFFLPQNMFSHRKSLISFNKQAQVFILI